MNFFKRLFCWHDWKKLKRIGSRSEVECVKCGIKDLRAREI